MTTNASSDLCILEYKIHAEYQQLIKNRIPNVYVIPSAHSSFIWYGVIFVRNGIYEGGIFRFTIFISDNFDCPRVIFNPAVYHPLINSDSGELDITQYISNWKRNIHHIYQVLYYVRRIFSQIETKNALNKEAAELCEHNYEAFKVKVNHCVEDCRAKIYNSPPINSDDSHAIKFTKLSDEAFAQIKQNMVNSALRIESMQETLNRQISSSCQSSPRDSNGSSYRSSNGSMKHNINNSGSQDGYLA